MLKRLLQFSDEILSDLNLDPELYKINSIEWDGEAYTNEDGVLCRKAAAVGNRVINDYEVIYGGDYNLPADANAYNWVGKYEATVNDPVGGTECPGRPVRGRSGLRHGDGQDCCLRYRRRAAGLPGHQEGLSGRLKLFPVHPMKNAVAHFCGALQRSFLCGSVPVRSAPGAWGMGVPADAENEAGRHKKSSV